MDFLHRFDSPLGPITLAADGDALVGLWFDGQVHFGETLSPEQAEKEMPVFEEADAWLRRYFDGRLPGPPPRLAPRGTPFRLAVWEALLSIPYGRTATYGEIAARIGMSASAARAVGGAVARNPISLMIPCHRVIGADGSLTGYAGGPERKRRLLRLEGVL